ncbi:OmpA family protein [Altererythrobacter sp. MF3-039]|uniref:OmpA family protein n=1 Tax=Altererythrobacter sp. MF3-039 TaxID=3252901 RepID=UPI00390CA998
MIPSYRAAAPLTLMTLLALTACNPKADEADEPGVDPAPAATASPVSIIRPELEEAKELPLAPLELRVAFPEGGYELDQQAKDVLKSALESPQYLAEGLITLRGHTDSAGSDDANLRASTARAEAVRDHLVEFGASEERFTIIAIGEQNPIEPNANLDGTPNEAGRRANRRVDLVLTVPSRPKAEEPDASQESPPPE